MNYKYVLGATCYNFQNEIVFFPVPRIFFVFLANIVEPGEMWHFNWVSTVC